MNLVVLRADSQRTSGQGCAAPVLAGSAESSPFSGESKVDPVMLTRRDVPKGGIIARLPNSLGSVRQERYRTGVIVGSSSLGPVVLHWAPGASDFLFFDAECRPVYNSSGTARSIVRGPGSASWTIETWALAAPPPAATDPAAADIRSLIYNLQRGLELASDAELDALVVRAAQHRGSPANVDAWARRLAEDVGDLSD